MATIDIRLRVLEGPHGVAVGTSLMTCSAKAHAITASKAPVALAYPKLKALAARQIRDPAGQRGCEFACFALSVFVSRLVFIMFNS